MCEYLLFSLFSLLFFLYLFCSQYKTQQFIWKISFMKYVIPLSPINISLNSNLKMRMIETHFTLYILQTNVCAQRSCVLCVWHEHCILRFLLKMSVYVESRYRKRHNLYILYHINIYLYLYMDCIQSNMRAVKCTEWMLNMLEHIYIYGLAVAPRG